MGNQVAELDELNADWIKQLPGAVVDQEASDFVVSLARGRVGQGDSEFVPELQAVKHLHLLFGEDPVAFELDCRLVLDHGTPAEAKALRTLLSKLTKYSPRGEEQKTRYWKQFDRRARSGEAAFASAAVQALERDKREVLAIVGEAQKSALRSKQSVNWQEMMFRTEEYFKVAGLANWREVYLPVMASHMSDAIGDFVMEFGLQFAVPNVGGLGWFDDYMLTFADPIVQTSSDYISELLKRGMEEGISVGEMQRRLQLTFQQWMVGDVDPELFDWAMERIPWYRAEMIARTETIRASNAGTYNQGVEWGVGWKEWLGTADDRIRDSHADAWSRYSEGGDPGPIPMDQPFELPGGKLMFPGDPSLGADPGEFIYCRCTWTPFQWEFASEEQASEGFGL